MKNVIIVTGASSGFGRMAAEELANAGHTVFAGMRETAERNAPQVEIVRKFSSEHQADLRAIEMDVPGVG